MRNEFTAIIERDGDWFISYCPEIPGANGQGRSKDECLESLRPAIELILEDRRDDAFRGVPPRGGARDGPRRMKRERWLSICR
jgi:predicted RNase H-like HicB family nuclease